MSADLRKMSEVISSDNLCYVKIPLDYNKTTDLYKYMIAVSSRRFDDRFNSHVFSLPVYQPNSLVTNDKFYKPKVSVSGSAEQRYYEHIDDGNDLLIQRPIGLLKINAPTGEDDMILYGNSEDNTSEEDIDINYLNVVGFRDNTLDIDLYGNMYDSIVSDDSPYHGALTDCASVIVNTTGEIKAEYYSGAEKTYHSFISKVGGDGDNGFIALGTSKVKMSALSLKEVINAEFSEYPFIDTIVLNGDTHAQMYTYLNNQWTAPMSKLPIDYYLHNDDVASGLVVFEKPIARIPDPIEKGLKPENEFSVADFCTLRVLVRNDPGYTIYTKTPCYMEPSDEGYVLGNIVNGKNTVTGYSGDIYKWYKIAEVVVTDEWTYGSEGDIPPWTSEMGPRPVPTKTDYNGPVLWLRIYDEDPENQCWIKFNRGMYTKSSDTKVGLKLHESDLFYFTVNGSMPSFDAFKWSYTVKQTNTTKPTSFPASDWNEFKYTLAPGDNPSDFHIHDLGYSLINDIDIQSSTGPKLENLGKITWFTSLTNAPNDRPFPYVYIKAEPILNPNPYKIVYLNTTNNDNLVRYSTADGSYIWSYSQSAESFDSAHIAERLNAKPNLIIDPYIVDDRVQVVIDYIDDSNSDSKWSDMGKVNLYLLSGNSEDGYEYTMMQDNRFARGSVIVVDAEANNGWNSGNVEVDYGSVGNKPGITQKCVTLSTIKEYDTAIIKVHFTKKTDPHYLTLENTDPKCGYIECIGATFDNTYTYKVNGVTKKGAYKFFPGDKIEFVAHPYTVDTDGYQMTNRLHSWEYEYDYKDSIGTDQKEWRMLSSKQHYKFVVSLYQIGDNVYKDLYNYRVQWCKECFMY